MKKFAVGIDIGGTNTKFGIVDREGTILTQGRMLTNARDTVQGFIEELYQHLSPMIEQSGGVNAFTGIGIGAPNGNYYTGNIEHAANLKWKGIVPLAAMIQERFGMNVKLTNDANAAAAGEQQYGCAKGMRDFITITLGTGVGSGIFINGRIVLGHDGFAGELGHTIIRPGGRLHPGTGIRGPLEAYASATGVRETALEMLRDHPTKKSLLRDISPEELTSEKVYECAIKGDEIAKEIFAFTGQLLGEALANFVMFSSPEAIVLFGGLTKAGDLILNPTRNAMEANLVQVFKNKVKLVFSNLKEADAAILGASALIWEEA
ncbi:MAG: ROK family protein [Chitinophagales bacterium]|jgi:glucokinase|nr:ROK family protein [Chitinophagales bacterium]